MARSRDKTDRQQKSALSVLFVMHQLIPFSALQAHGGMSVEDVNGHCFPSGIQPSP
jgi:hypothetical protein